MTGLYSRIKKNLGEEIENIWIIDKLPILTKLYEKYPTNADKITGKELKWYISKLAKNEEKILSYIFYSDVGYVGRLEMPVAIANLIDSRKKLRSINSNKLFVIAEQI